MNLKSNDATLERTVESKIEIEFKYRKDEEFPLHIDGMGESCYVHLAPGSWAEIYSQPPEQDIANIIHPCSPSTFYTASYQLPCYSNNASAFLEYRWAATAPSRPPAGVRVPLF